MKRRVDWFLMGMLLAVALAWLFPAPGARGGVLHPEFLTKLGVAIIFFSHGLALPLQALRAGTLQWKTHLLVQGCTFLLFPIVGLVLLSLAGDRISPELRTGLFYLCALPSTVSTSIAMTAVAGGHVAVAVFNASLSSLLGIFFTPLWMEWFTHSSGHRIPLGPVILNLLTWLALPLTIGQLLRPWFGAWATARKKLLNRIDRGTILVLVYTSFCDSVRGGIWTRHALGSILFSFAASVILFCVVFWLVKWLSRKMVLSRPDQIAAIFCGSKKTLAAGVPMAQLIFAGNPALSLILLPIMIYHPFQLVVCGMIAEKWALQKPAGS